MKKRIGDMTFSEFDEWANKRACDGKWSLFDAMVCTEIITRVLSVKPLFGRKKAREKEWERLRAENLKLDSELEV